MQEESKWLDEWAVKQDFFLTEYASMNHPNPAAVSYCHPPIPEDE